MVGWGMLLDVGWPNRPPQVALSLQTVNQMIRQVIYTHCRSSWHKTGRRWIDFVCPFSALG